MVKIVKKSMELLPKIYSYEFTSEMSQEEQNRSGKAELAMYNRYISQIFDKNPMVTVVSKKN